MIVGGTGHQADATDFITGLQLIVLLEQGQDLGRGHAADGAVGAVAHNENTTLVIQGHGIPGYGDQTVIPGQEPLGIGRIFPMEKTGGPAGNGVIAQLDNNLTSLGDFGIARILPGNGEGIDVTKPSRLFGCGGMGAEKAVPVGHHLGQDRVVVTAEVFH